MFFSSFNRNSRHNAKKLRLPTHLPYNKMYIWVTNMLCERVGIDSPHEFTHENLWLKYAQRVVNQPIYVYVLHSQPPFHPSIPICLSHCCFFQFFSCSRSHCSHWMSITLPHLFGCYIEINLHMAHTSNDWLSSWNGLILRGHFYIQYEELQEVSMFYIAVESSANST